MSWKIRAPAVLAVLLCVAGAARAEEPTEAEAPVEAVKPRLGLLATLGLGLSQSVDFTLGLGLYPWRWAGLEVRHLWVMQDVEAYTVDGSGAHVPVQGGRDLVVDGTITELAVVARLHGLEPWVSVGHWSGQVDDGDTGGCGIVCLPGPPLFEQGPRLEVPVSSAGTVGVGVRYHHPYFVLGLEARHVFFDRSAVRISADGREVPLRGDLLGVSLGILLGGPVERGE